MNILTKMSYMAFGSLLTLIGYHFGNIDNDSANAQIVITPSETEIIDEIRCRNRIVVGDDDTPRGALGTNDVDRGAIVIYNEDEVRRIFIGVALERDQGMLAMNAKDSSGETTVQLSTDNKGGYTGLWNNVLDTPFFKLQ